MKLSRYFSLEELTASETAARRGIDNTPPEGVMDNLVRLAQALDDVRELLGHPVIVSSGYRSPEVNALVGGSLNPPSAHTYGRAADFICPGFGSPFEVAIMLAGIEYDQLIHEFGRWVHLGIAPEGTAPRQQAMTYTRAGQPPVAGIVAV